MEIRPISFAELAEADSAIGARAKDNGVPADDLKVSLWSLWFPAREGASNAGLAQAWIGKTEAEIRARYGELLKHDPDGRVEKSTQLVQIELLQRGFHFKDGLLYRTSEEG